MKDQSHLVIEQFLTLSPGNRADIRIFFAPGRVNLIGEHTDYNGGYVFPAALTYGTWAVVRPRSDGKVTFASTGFENRVERDVANLVFIGEDDFANYPKGVIKCMSDRGIHFGGADFLFHGTIPSGAGLSSSASVELVTAFAVNALTGSSLPTIELVKLSQQAENQFVGVNCGIMDQFAVGMGVAGKAILLKCDSLDYRFVPFKCDGLQLIITNTNKRRGLADSKYNERREECDIVVAMLQKAGQRISHLADVSPAQLHLVEQIVGNDVLFRRAKHVITENARVHTAAAALEASAFETFGKLMIASHESLRTDYEVTGIELDTLVEEALQVMGCIGSRMTGAGFGGCTVSLVAEDQVGAFKHSVGTRYESRTGLTPAFYIADIGDGVREITE